MLRKNLKRKFKTFNERNNLNRYFVYSFVHKPKKAQIYKRTFGIIINLPYISYITCSVFFINPQAGKIYNNDE